MTELEEMLRAGWVVTMDEKDSVFRVHGWHRQKRVKARVVSASDTSLESAISALAAKIKEHQK